jgi:cell pole-organizing protein PopZ
MKNNLEEIVKQLLKPLLRDWLERNLPELLKGVVDEETGKIDPNKW